jgi:hypothetical protein
MKKLTQELKYSFLRMSLLPVARFCLRHSLKLQDLQSILKEVLVSESKILLEKDGVEISDSKISLITGVHRKDVALMQAGIKIEAPKADLLTKVLGQWQVDKDFSTKGIPNVLTTVGKDSDFVRLVTKVGKEINPYTVLFELERAGLVRKKDSQLTALMKEYVPAANAEEIFQTYIADGTDLISTVENNALNKNQKHFHLRTEFDNIPKVALAEIHKWIFSEGEKFHKKARNKLSRYDRDTSKLKSKDTETVRVAITLFEFSEQLKNNKEE